MSPRQGPTPDSSAEAAYSTRRPVRLVGRPLSLRQSSTRPTTRPVGSGPTRATPQTPRGVSRDASGQRPDSSDHGRVGSGPTPATPQTPRACRATRPASGPTRPTTVVSARARLVRLLRLLGRVARRVAPAARLVRHESCRLGLGPDSCDSSDSSALIFFLVFFWYLSVSTAYVRHVGRLRKETAPFKGVTSRRCSDDPDARMPPPPPLPLRPRALRACRCAPDHPTSESRSSRSVAATRASARRWRCRVHRSMAKVGVQPRALFESDELLVVRMRQLLADSVAQPHERARRMPTTT